MLCGCRGRSVIGLVTLTPFAFSTWRVQTPFKEVWGPPYIDFSKFTSSPFESQNGQWSNAHISSKNGMDTVGQILSLSLLCPGEYFVIRHGYYMGNVTSPQKVSPSRCKTNLTVRLRFSWWQALSTYSLEVNYIMM